MTKHIPYLDGWRGLAIACLLIGHFFPISGINLGTVGVELFFVLSGLLMAQLLFVEKTKLTIFYQRRISRIVPSVLVYLGIITGIFLIEGKHIAKAELLSAITFTNNYFVTLDWTMPFGHIWSLSVEEHAYIIMSLAALWSQSRGSSALRTLTYVLFLIGLAIGIYAVPGMNVPEFNLRTEVASLGIFLSGFLIVAVRQGDVQLGRKWLAPAGLIVGVLVHWWSVPLVFRLVMGPAALAVAINSMSSAPGWFLAIFELRWLRQLGIYSFSLYLWQQPFYQLADEGLPPILAVAFSLGVGWLAFHLIENPARSYLNKRWSKKAAISKAEQFIAKPN